MLGIQKLKLLVVSSSSRKVCISKHEVHRKKWLCGRDIKSLFAMFLEWCRWMKHIKNEADLKWALDYIICSQIFSAFQDRTQRKRRAGTDSLAPTGSLQPGGHEVGGGGSLLMCVGPDSYAIYRMRGLITQRCLLELTAVIWDTQMEPAIGACPPVRPDKLYLNTTEYWNQLYLWYSYNKNKGVMGCFTGFPEVKTKLKFLNKNIILLRMAVTPILYNKLIPPSCSILFNFVASLLKMPTYLHFKLGHSKEANTRALVFAKQYGWVRNRRIMNCRFIL